MAKKATSKVLMGRQIAKLKADAIAAAPDASDDEIAQQINAVSKREGYTTQGGNPIWFAAQDIHSARSPRKPAPAPKQRARKVATAAPAPSAPSSGSFMAQLQQAVQVIGKDGVAKLLEGM